VCPERPSRVLERPWLAAKGIGHPEQGTHPGQRRLGLVTGDEPMKPDQLDQADARMARLTVNLQNAVGSARHPNCS
jgi:hypothetical protein